MSGHEELQDRIDRALDALNDGWHCEECLILDLRHILRGEK
jgi:hypothetical protein